jgi:oxygen-independent coproporphyrinogen-3 oxidase
MVYNNYEGGDEMKGLYIHIPFCESLCHYCDFVKRIPKNNKVIDEYLTVLINEINSYQSHFNSITSIYLGGGTPSMLSEAQLTRLFESLKSIRPQEFTVEVNPESYNHQKGVIFKKYGVNRISLGVQTFNENLLKYLNRKHTINEVADCVLDLKSLGIHNLSVDLIFAIPGQTIDDIRRDLKYVNDLGFQHLSYYSLILEDKTYFYHQYLREKFHTIDEDLEALMYETIVSEAIKLGFNHYEISNFAKASAESLHNTLYWTLGEYIGCGLGAHGFIDNHRTYNQTALAKYLKNPRDEVALQTESSLLGDELIFGLRRLVGVNIKALNQKYQVDILNDFSSLGRHIANGLLVLDGDYLKISSKGLLVGNQIFMEFI